MEQFVVPQFIDVEDKIIGPITTRQFVIMLVTAGFIFLAYRFLYFVQFLLVTAVILIIGLSLAFIRVNGRPFHFFLLNLLQTSRRPRLRTWNKHLTDEEVRLSMKAPISSTTAPKLVARPPLASSRLSELSLMVDTGGVYKGEE